MPRTAKELFDDCKDLYRRTNSRFLLLSEPNYKELYRRAHIATGKDEIYLLGCLYCLIEDWPSAEEYFRTIHKENSKAAYLMIYASQKSWHLELNSDEINLLLEVAKQNSDITLDLSDIDKNITTSTPKSLPMLVFELIKNESEGFYAKERKRALATMLAHGWGCAVDKSAAAELLWELIAAESNLSQQANFVELKKLAASNDQQIKLYYYECLARGYGSPEDVRFALHPLKSIITSGKPKEIYILARLLKRSGRNLPEMADCFYAAAKQGALLGHTSIAMQAFAELKKRADSGNFREVYYTYRCLVDSYGCQKNPEMEARYWNKVLSIHSLAEVLELAKIANKIGHEMEAGIFYFGLAKLNSVAPSSVSGKSVSVFAFEQLRMLALKNTSQTNNVLNYASCLCFGYGCAVDYDESYNQCMRMLAIVPHQVNLHLGELAAVKKDFEGAIVYYVQAAKMTSSEEQVAAVKRGLQALSRSYEKAAPYLLVVEYLGSSVAINKEKQRKFLQALAIVPPSEFSALLLVANNLFKLKEPYVGALLLAYLFYRTKRYDVLYPQIKESYQNLKKLDLPHDLQIMLSDYFQGMEHSEADSWLYQLWKKDINTYSQQNAAWLATHNPALAFYMRILKEIKEQKSTEHSTPIAEFESWDFSEKIEIIDSLVNIYLSNPLYQDQVGRRLEAKALLSIVVRSGSEAAFQRYQQYFANAFLKILQTSAEDEMLDKKALQEFATYSEVLIDYAQCLFQSNNEEQFEKIYRHIKGIQSSRFLEKYKDSEAVKYFNERVEKLRQIIEQKNILTTQQKNHEQLTAALQLITEKYIGDALAVLQAIVPENIPAYEEVQNSLTRDDYELLQEAYIKTWSAQLLQSQNQHAILEKAGGVLERGVLLAGPLCVSVCMLLEDVHEGINYLNKFHLLCLKLVASSLVKNKKPPAALWEQWYSVLMKVSQWIAALSALSGQNAQALNDVFLRQAKEFCVLTGFFQVAMAQRAHLLSHSFASWRLEKLEDYYANLALKTLQGLQAVPSLEQHFYPLTFYLAFKQKDFAGSKVFSALIRYLENLQKQQKQSELSFLVSKLFQAQLGYVTEKTKQPELRNFLVSHKKTKTLLSVPSSVQAARDQRSAIIIAESMRERPYAVANENSTEEYKYLERDASIYPL